MPFVESEEPTKQKIELVSYCPVHESFRAQEIRTQGNKPLPVTCSDCLPIVESLGKLTDKEKKIIDKI